MARNELKLQLLKPLPPKLLFFLDLKSTNSLASGPPGWAWAVFFHGNKLQAVAYIHSHRNSTPKGGSLKSNSILRPTLKDNPGLGSNGTEFSGSDLLEMRSYSEALTRPAAQETWAGRR